MFVSSTALLCCLGTSQAQTNTQIEREREKERHGDVYIERQSYERDKVPRRRKQLVVAIDGGEDEKMVQKME
jgi:hypothetical protein